jgi:hypothetical protein
MKRTSRRSRTPAAARGIWVIVDLCYERLIYERVPHNLPRILFDRLRDRTVIAGSASKAYAMTGWRCGWTIAPKELTAAFNVIQGQSTSNITSITQKAALAAITGSQDPVTAMLDEYRRRRDSIHAWLTANPGDSVREAERRVLSVPRHLTAAVCGWRRDVCGLRAGVAREGARRGDAWRGVRCAGLPPHLVRDVDGAVEERVRHAFFASLSRCNRPGRRLHTDLRTHRPSTSSGRPE